MYHEPSVYSTVSQTFRSNRLRIRETDRSIICRLRPTTKLRNSSHLGRPIHVIVQALQPPTPSCRLPQVFSPGHHGRLPSGIRYMPIEHLGHDQPLGTCTTHLWRRSWRYFAVYGMRRRVRNSLQMATDLGAGSMRARSRERRECEG